MPLFYRASSPRKCVCAVCVFEVQMSLTVLVWIHVFCWLACYSWEKGTATEYLQRMHNGEANWSVCTFFVCVRACMCLRTPCPPFPASHCKGLFGFIVQEGLCTQLAHLYKFSLYGVLWNACIGSLRCMTLPCAHTTLLFNSTCKWIFPVCTGECMHTFEPSNGWTEPSLWN